MACPAGTHGRDVARRRAINLGYDVKPMASLLSLRGWRAVITSTFQAITCRPIGSLQGNRIKTGEGGFRMPSHKARFFASCSCCEAGSAGLSTRRTFLASAAAAALAAPALVRAGAAVAQTAARAPAS